MLYRAYTFTPNLGLEIGLSKRITLDISGGYNWFNLKGDTENNKICNINTIDELLRLKDGSDNPIYKTQEDLDREDTYTFTIHLNSDLSVTIRVNGWITEVIDKPFT